MASKEVKQKYEGHTDFVRAVVTTRLQGKDVLVSGGADAQILVFDIASGERISVMKGHAKGIQGLVVDPVSLDSDNQELVVFSSGSDREIRRFDIASGSKDLTGTDAILVHDTNVYKLFFDRDTDLWTASADKTAKCLVREDGWKPNLTLTHPDFVRDVVVYEQGGWVVTACRDEEVRVWNRSVSVLVQPVCLPLLINGTDRTTLPYFLWPFRRGHRTRSPRLNACQRQYRCHHPSVVLEARGSPGRYRKGQEHFGK